MVGLPLLGEQKRGQRHGCGLRFGAGDGDVGELVGARALLHQVHEALFGGPEGARPEPCQFRALLIRQPGEHREDVENQKAAMVLEPVARGRVWTGVDARERGLIDHLGGMNLAIDRACALASVKRSDVAVRPVSMLGFLKQFKPAELKLLAQYIGSLPGELRTLPQPKFR